MNSSTQLLNQNMAHKKLKRMAIQIAEANAESSEIILAGIKENGLLMAEIIAGYLKQFTNAAIYIQPILMDKKSPLNTTINFSTKNKTIILIDDVANSGKTLAFALSALLSEIPNSIQTLVLVERTHKQFPVEINFRGMAVSTTRGEHISVNIQNKTVQEAVLIQNNSI